MWSVILSVILAVHLDRGVISDVIAHDRAVQACYDLLRLVNSR